MNRRFTTWATAMKTPHAKVADRRKLTTIPVWPGYFDLGLPTVPPGTPCCDAVAVLRQPDGFIAVELAVTRSWASDCSN
jgi:hypothetical protein